MKIVYILASSWGGIPHYTAELANAMAKYADVTVIKPKDSNNVLFSPDVNVIGAFKPMQISKGNEMKAASLHNIKNLFSYRNIRIINKLKPDIVHFTLPYPHVLIFTSLYGLNREYPTIYTIHGIAESSHAYSVSIRQRGFGGALLNRINELVRKITKPDKTIVHTEANKDALIKEGISPEKIDIVPHGAYTFFRKYPEDKIESEENVILYFGYIVKPKGIEYLIKAVPIVSNEIPDIKIIIAGEGDFSTYLKYIEDKSKFEVYNEFIPNEKVSELFQRAKFVVLPYTYHQGHSGVLTVAFSFGKPVIVTNVGDLPNLIEDGKEGLVVPPKNPEALADAIIKLLKDNELRRKMEENAYKKVQELSWDNIAKKHIEVYEGVLEERGV